MPAEFLGRCNVYMAPINVSGSLQLQGASLSEWRALYKIDNTEYSGHSSHRKGGNYQSQVDLQTGIQE